MSALSNVKAHGGETNPPSVGIVSDAIPEAANSEIGVSVEYAHTPSRSR